MTITKENILRQLYKSRTRQELLDLMISNPEERHKVRFSSILENLTSKGHVVVGIKQTTIPKSKDSPECTVDVQIYERPRKAA